LSLTRAQIEKYAKHILDTPALHANLSGAELAHCRKYTELVASHFQHSVLDSLPEWLRNMDDSNNGVSMGEYCGFWVLG
jgi:GINS complex subunit 4